MTKIIITIENIDLFENECYPNIVSVVWEAGLLVSDVIKKFYNLEEFDCGGNKLKNLEGLPMLSKLRYLNCAHNKISTLKGMPCFPELHIFCCQHNKLRNFENMPKLPKLEKLYCDCNKLCTLKKMPVLPKLQLFYCMDNELPTISDMPIFPELQIFDCWHNNIADFERIMEFSTLIVFEYGGNQCKFFSTQLQQFIKTVNDRNMIGTIYNNNDNVHDANIQRTVKESIVNLMSDPKPESFDIEEILNSDIDPVAKSIVKYFYNSSETYCALNMTYSEFIPYLWQRIKSHTNSDTMIKIFEQNMLDNEGRCIIGMFSRSVSTLCGFYSDISIEISNTSRIQVLIKKAKCENKFSRKYIETILEEAGYGIDEIKTWLEELDIEE